MKTIERRQFIKTSLFALAALVFPGNLRRALAAAPLPAGQTPVPANDPVATAIGYKAEVKDIDYKRYPARKKPEAKNQFCENSGMTCVCMDSEDDVTASTIGEVLAGVNCQCYENINRNWEAPKVLPPPDQVYTAAAPAPAPAPPAVSPAA